MKKLMAVAAAGVLLFSACGSDGGSGGNAKDELFDAMMGELTSGDDAIPDEALDESCIRAAIDDIPDDQAQILADNIDFEGEDLPEGVDEEAILALTGALFDCVDIGALIEEG